MQPPPDPGWWFRNPPSNELVWVTIVLAIVGFVFAVMALPTVLQMFGGKPKAVLEFDFFFEGRPDTLRCSIGQPFVARWLQRVGVRRTAIAITVSFEIKRVSDGRVVDQHSLCHIVNVLKKESGREMILSESVTPFLCVYIVNGQDPPNVTVFTHADDDEEIEPVALRPDTYEVSVCALYGGHETGSASRRFLVTADGTLAWLGLVP